jgi:molybdenum ABC transporter molybdate-binding protein
MMAAPLMAKKHWTNDWKVGVRVWVERDGQAVLGEGRAELLAAIDQERSITKAAKSVGMSYRRAWNLIQEINSAAGLMLVEAATGGVKGGGAKLTQRGHVAVDVYEQVRQSLVESAAGVLQRTTTDGERSATLHLAAAISLQEAVGQILAEFALQQPSVRVRAIFGASNELADQLLAGAPGDVFFSADPATLDRLESANRLVSGSRRIIAQNGLAVIARPRTPAISTISDLLSKRFKQVALAEPACPLGHYSMSYLAKARVYDALLPKVLHVDNSRAVLAAVASGSADAGVAFSSDAVRPSALRTVLRVPISQASATYTAAIVVRGQVPATARQLLDFLLSSAARRCLRRCGFKVPKA